MIASILLALLLATGGGTAYAAENALPGDALYPVKVSVNETVREALTFGDEHKADWAVRRVERRLEEIVKLSAAGKLTEEKVEKISANFEKHLEKVKQKAAEFQEQGNLNAAEKMAEKAEAILQAHEEFLSGEKTVKLVEAMKVGVEKFKERKAEIINKVETGAEADKESAANGAKIAAENKLSEVRKFVENKTDKVSSAAVKKAQDVLAAAEAIRTQANSKMESKEFVVAFKLYHEAMWQVQGAKTVFNIDTATEKIEAVKLKMEEKMQVKEQKKVEKEQKKGQKNKKGSELPAISGVQVETSSGAGITVSEMVTE